jgi:class 3 adenylate cyclase
MVGEGADLVLLGDWTVPLEARWDEPRMAGPLRRLSNFARVLTFDRRGTGQSDPVALVDVTILEVWAEDVATVMDAVGMERAVIIGAQDGGHVAQLFAATRPERTTALVLMNTIAWGSLNAPVEPDHVRNVPRWQRQQVAATDEWWGGTAYFRITAPSLVGDRELLKRLARQVRHQASPGTAQAVLAALTETDTRGILESIGVPTLVLHASADSFWSADHGRYLAEHIPAASFVEISACDHLWWTDNPDGFLDEVEQFVTGVRRGPDPERVLATVLFTDIVSSTKRAAALGDRAWREVLGAHHRLVRRELDRHRGREIKTTGDGFLATFDGPARAIQCACAIRDGARELDLPVRAGIHTGEIELTGNDIAGVAVHVAARLLDYSDPNEVVVSGAVPLLMAGSGVGFEDRGEHELKGVPGTWKLFTVRG